MVIAIILSAIVCAVLLRSLIIPMVAGGGLGLGAVMAGPMVNFPVDERVAFAMLALGTVVGLLNSMSKLFPAKKDDKKGK